MAWYAIYEWAVTFRKKPFEVDWIAWYRKKLYDEWFESLSEEDKEKVREYQARKKKEKDERYARSLYTLVKILTGMCGDHYIGDNMKKFM